MIQTLAQWTWHRQEELVQRSSPEDKRRRLQCRATPPLYLQIHSEPGITQPLTLAGTAKTPYKEYTASPTSLLFPELNTQIAEGQNLELEGIAPRARVSAQTAPILEEKGLLSKEQARRLQV